MYEAWRAALSLAGRVGCFERCSRIPWLFAVLRETDGKEEERTMMRMGKPKAIPRSTRIARLRCRSGLITVVEEVRNSGSYLSAGDGNILDSSNLVETPVNAERCSGNGYRGSHNQSRS